LTKYMDKEVRVKFNGGREGTLISHLGQPVYGIPLLNMTSLWNTQGLRSAHEPGLGRCERVDAW
jgi:hypothetical protein